MIPKSIQSTARKMFVCLMLLFCFGLIKIQVAAQDSDVLSRNPPVIRVFDPDKNESLISALLIDPTSSEARTMMGFDPNRPPPEIQLRSAQYSYPGKTPSRPQAIAFVFLPLNRYKLAPDFSVTADGTVLSEGQATFEELCCSRENGRDKTQQQIIVALPLDIMERIKQAKKVELKLASKSGKYAFKLNQYQKKSLVALVDTIK